MVYTRKFSQFEIGGDLTNTDNPVGLRSGANTIFTFSGGGGGGGGATTATITQPAGGPTLSLGQWVRINVTGIDSNPGAYTPALATNAHLGEVIGVVIAIVSSNQYTIQQAGYIPDTVTLFPSLNPGSPYFLDTSTAGNMVITDVNASGQDSRPVFVADGVNSGWVVPYRGFIVDGLGVTGGGGSPGVDSNIHTISQAGNGFSIGDWVYVSGNNVYSLADASALASAQSIGVVISQGDPDFTVQFGGWLSGAITMAVDATGNPIAITSSTVYYISDTAPGAITPFPGAISKPAYISESSTALTGWVLPQRPVNQITDDNSVTTVTQANNFQPGNWLYIKPDQTYGLASAASLDTAQVAGVVLSADSGSFVLQSSGFNTGAVTQDQSHAPLASGSTYYLSTTVPGALQSTDPSLVGQFSKPLYIQQDLATSKGLILNQRPLAAGTAPAPGVVGIASVISAVNSTPNISIAANVTLPGLSITFTPSFTTSKVLITACVNVGSGIGSSTGLHVSLVRNGVKIPQANNTSSGCSFSGSGGAFGESFTLTFLDSPGVTSACTYTLLNNTTASTLNISGISTLTGMLLNF